MKYKSVIKGIVVLSLLIMAGGTVAGFGIARNETYLIIAGIILSAIAVVSLYAYFNRINHKLTYFFDAIRNNDNTLSFSENVPNKTLKRLHKSMNQTNLLLKKWKNESEKRELFYMELIEHSNTGFVVFDDEGYTSVINSTAKYYLGLHIKSNLKLLKQKNSDLHNVFSNQVPGQTQTIRTIIYNEPAFLSIGLSMLKFDNKTYRLFSIKNIKQELDEKELESWQKLIRVLTHEIMNSIAPITSLSSTISGFFKSNNSQIAPENITKEIIADTLEGLEVIEDRGNGLKKFVESYRAMSKLPEPEFKSIKLVPFFKKIQRLAEPFSRSGVINIQASIQGLSKILADEELLTQVLINLLKNSCEAMDKTEKPLVEIIGTFNTQNNPVIIVKDNGGGIPDEIQERMFIPFFTTKENGSGIGLSLCRQIMRLQNGSISIVSELDQGTTVSLTFK